MIIVTGGAGFIGSNLVKALNDRGERDILVVDDLSSGAKFKNIADCDIADYMDKDDFAERLEAGKDFWGAVRVVFHQGACSTTTEWDGRYMMRNNFEYSKQVLRACQRFDIPCLYASSAAVYGGGSIFSEDPAHEQPLNVYGYSKYLFDQFVRRREKDLGAQVAGFRYFNVYGPREHHKGTMASVAFHLHQQMLRDGKVRLFEGNDGYEDGEQRRDFIHVDDAVAVNLWFWDHPEARGIFNVGTGRSQSFNDVANAVIASHERGELIYIPFPEHLKGRYQSFTEADISRLRAVGYDAPFLTVEAGVSRYIEWLNGPGAGFPLPG